jgi:AraC-like DNA-binding protein
MTEVIFLGAVFCALITAYLLLFNKTPFHIFSNTALAWFLIFSSYCISGYLLIDSGWIQKVPFLYKTSAPINFLLPPLAYFYVKSVLYNRNCFKKIDFLHLLPFIIFLISYLPFYLIALKDKEVIVKKLFNLGLLGQNNDGLIPEYIQFLVRETQSFVYLFFQWQLLINFKKSNLITYFEVQTRQVLNWLRDFTVSITISAISFIVFVILMQIGDDGLFMTIFSNLSSLMFAISFFIITSYLLFRPTVLYGFPFINNSQDNKVEKKLNQTEVNVNVKGYESEIIRITNYFNENKPYIKNNLSINEVAMAIEIPARDVSFIINNHFQQRFSDFVNMHRIQHFINEIENGNLNKFTIEFIAKASGFSSITTFNRAFKKTYTISPSEYFQQLNASS